MVQGFVLARPQLVPVTFAEFQQAVPPAAPPAKKLETSAPRAPAGQPVSEAPVRGFGRRAVRP
jgi:hypothetical protein